LKRHAIVSLLASATEIVDALGATHLLVGRSHECDYPPSILALPVCTKPLIDVEANSRDIDEQVRNSARNAISIYEVFDGILERLQPTHILTQVQCDVCAVSLSDVERSVASRLASAPQVVALHPCSLADIWEDFRRVAEAAEVPAEPLIEALQDRMQPVQRTHRPTVACIEWIEPLMAAGNWTPELIGLAGGFDVFGKPGVHSPWISWEDLLAKDPEIIIVAPCGFNLDRTLSEMHWLTENANFGCLRAVRTGRLFVADGNQYFNRPGPRVVETLRIIREILDFTENPQSLRSCRSGMWSLYSRKVSRSPLLS
jgi:iron complex transport system substrate-binding protein